MPGKKSKRQARIDKGIRYGEQNGTPNPRYTENPKDSLTPQDDDGFPFLGLLLDGSLEAPESPESFRTRPYEPDLKFDESRYQEEGEWEDPWDDGNLKWEPKTLGRGAYGEVRELTSKEQLDGGEQPNKVALKVPNGGHGDSVEFEGGVLQNLGKHKNIVGFEGMGVKGNEPTLALEFLGGGNLEDMQQRLSDAYKARKISHSEYWGTMQYLLREVTTGLGAMHEQGMVHGDLKPGNVGLDHLMSPKLLDFGSTREVGKKPGPYTHDVNLTPETAGGRPVHENHDMYALGQMTHQSRFGGYHDVGPKAPTLNGRISQIVDLRDKAFNQDPNAPLGFDFDRGNVPDTDLLGFLRDTLSPLPDDRFSPQEALESPFLKDSLLDDRGAKEVLRRMREDQVNKVDYGKPKTDLQLFLESQARQEQRKKDREKEG